MKKQMLMVIFACFISACTLPNVAPKNDSVIILEEVKNETLKNETLRPSLDRAQSIVSYQKGEVHLIKKDAFDGGLYVEGNSLFIVIKSPRLLNGRAYTIGRAHQKEDVLIGADAKNNTIEMGLNDDERGLMAVVDMETKKELLYFSL